MSVGQAVQVCLEIARALQYAHEKGFIHRDVKPDNILLTADGAQLSDFGIAKDTVSDPNHTRTRAVMGTLQYMSPEQRLNTKNITVQTDIYALVATFFNLMTLMRPSICLLKIFVKKWSKSCRLESFNRSSIKVAVESWSSIRNDV